MISDYLSSLEGVGGYFIFSLCIFVAFFLGVGVWMARADRKWLRRMSELPLEGERNGLHTEEGRT
ncbi:MAG: hypothetical protein WB626_04725 [Bacteroidota bacterium]